MMNAHSVSTKRLLVVAVATLAVVMSGQRAHAQPGSVQSHQKISDTQGDFKGILDDADVFGVSVASLGDLDGDGVGDLAVGAFWDDDGGRKGSDRGAVWILFLNSNGTVKSHQKISSTQGGGPPLDIDDGFGVDVAALGDLDGDGVGDLAVGAIRDDDGGTDRGAVWILFLNTDGTVNHHQKISSTQGGGPRLDNGDEFGVSAASLGDLDGDGPSVLALAVGVWRDDDGGFERGAVWILFLNANGTVNSHQKISSTAGGGPPLGNGDQFGISAASLGDLDGDGVGDLAVGAWGDDDGRAAVWILFLNPDGTVITHQKISDTEGGFTGTLGTNDRFGVSVGSLGDLDGDGVDDLAVGAAFDDDGGMDRGAVWILFLNTDGTVHAHQKISDTQGGFTGTLDNGDWFGTSVASLGDLDGDGPSVRALAVGAIRDDDGGLNRGAVWVLFLDGVPASTADITGPLGVPDGCVDAFDLGTLLGVWCSSAGDPDPPGDIDPPCEGCTSPNFALADISGAAMVPDGCVDAFDLAKLLAEWCSVAGGNPCGTCGP